MLIIFNSLFCVPYCKCMVQLHYIVMIKNSKYNRINHFRLHELYNRDAFLLGLEMCVGMMTLIFQG
jgi:hypothetical protein